MNQLHFGDNLDVLRKYVKDESVDLIYLDPPFNSSANYNVLFKERDGAVSEAQAEAFKDTWAWGHIAAEAFDDGLRAGGDVGPLLRSFRSWLGDSGLMAYLAMMTVRLVELRRVMKPTASLYLHCDPTSSHYLKVFLDAIFGTDRFRSEVIWKRSSSHNRAKRWGPVHDTILFYSAGDKYTWNRTFSDYEQSYLDGKYRHKDADGRRYRLSDLTGPGKRTGDCGEPWREIAPTDYGRHWEPPHDRALPKWFQFPLGWSKMSVRERLEIMHEQNLIQWPKKIGGRPEFRRYLESAPGQPIQDVIIDVDPINSMAQERLGYPTQKPIPLLERIIKASSNEGDLILDPFCGCGTTIEAAEQLKRDWIGIDITHYAVTLIETRLRATHPGAEYKIFGRPTDLAGARDLAHRDKYQFQWWAAWKLGAQTYETKKGADRGIDGNIFFPNGPYGYGRIIISVKGGENVSPVMVRELSGVIQREDAEMGILVTLNEPTRAMVADAAGAGFVEKSAHGRLPRIQIVTVADLVDGRLPKLPPLPVAHDGPRQRVRKRDNDQLELMLPFAGSGGLRAEDGGMIDPRFVKFG